ncbi:MAG TPA: ribonuclease H-like domain-containing protein [Candidatus Binatia bacterium]|nr:ribonuclease H-like domain-containing protein [Candidatus Binatia bacterium]
MVPNKIVFDLETQKSFEEVGGRGRNDLLRISVLGLYSYNEDKYYCFEENEIYRAGEMFQEADQIIGFNIKGFDFEVLRPYVNFDVHALPYLDILEEVVKALGHRLKLESLAQATLGTGKSADGMEALRMFRQGRMDELKKYCTQDVKVTKEIYDYVLKNQKLLYKDYFETREIQMTFPEPVIRKPVARQTALF